MQTALAQWHAPRAAEQIAESILNAVFRSVDSVSALLAQDVDVRMNQPQPGVPKQEHVCAA
jgi:hypothetical protein